MLEKPDIQDVKIVACLQDEYGLPVVQVAFLPLGADLNTAVYRALTDDDTAYFAKLRQGVFDETSVALPKFISDQGIGHLIAPLTTKTGQLWASLDAFKLILYPFVEGQNAYEVALSDRHWGDLGATLKSIHTTVVPPALTRCIQKETYSPQWREIVKAFLERVEIEDYDDPVAREVAALLKAKRHEIADLVRRAERLAVELQARSPDFVLCHSDIHAGNVLIGAAEDLYVVDWDSPILAPKERDLMYVGGGLLGGRRTPREEENLFYQGYGQTQIDPVALAYYRYERIIQDIAVECEQLLLTNEGGADREQSLGYLVSNFLPNGVIDIAYKADKTLGERAATKT
jgi:spectinomycin phosphotransferase